MFTNRDINPSLTNRGIFLHRPRRRGGKMIANIVLADTIRAAQTGDNDSMLILLNRFEHLLNKYARDLNMEYQDAKQEMALSFIILIARLELSVFRDTSNGPIVSYVAKAMHRAYILISKKNKIPVVEIPIDEVEDSLQLSYCSFDDYANVYIDELKAVLTEKEFCILCRHYLLDEPIEKIARELGISRQRASRIRKQVRQKLRDFYEGAYP